MNASESSSLPRRVSLAVLTFYWLLLFAGTHVPRLRSLPLQHSDKMLHAGAYTGLALLVALAWSQWRPFGVRQLAAAAAVLIFYASFDEITQPLVGRVADWIDWAADLAGIVAGFAIFAVARALWRRARKPAVG